MSEFDHKQLDEIIHSRLRLAIMSMLISIEEIEFSQLKKSVNATDGNLSIHLKKLEDAGYISVKKDFRNRKPVTTYRLTAKGRKAFEKYIDHLEKLVKLH